MSTNDYAGVREISDFVIAHTKDYLGRLLDEGRINNDEYDAVYHEMEKLYRDNYYGREVLDPLQAPVHFLWTNLEREVVQNPGVELSRLIATVLDHHGKEEVAFWVTKVRIEYVLNKSLLDLE